MKKFISLFCVMIALVFFANVSNAQVSTNSGSGLAASYPDLATAITALNGATITSPVIISVDAANPQSAPAGGYVITATGTAANTITLTGNGNTITASATLTVGNLNDAIFRLSGSDYVTIQGFTMQENAANIVTAAATNTMTEWGVALLYASATDGCQNVTIQNNTITLNRTYQNTFGIYANSTHTFSAVTTSATATGATGGNHNLKIYGNTINNINQGIVVVGPTAAADQNTGLDIGGASLTTANVITNYGTTGTFSAYANVSGTVNGILIRNSIGFNCSYNTVTSSVGGVTAGTLNGIQVPTASVAPTTTFTNNITYNSISLKSGFATGAMNGINYPAGSASTTSTLNITNNDFNNWGHTVVASGAIIFITTASINLNTTISNNTFTNMTVNTTGSVTFISQTFTLNLASGTKTVSGNSIVTGFSKTGAGGTVLLVTDYGSSTNVVQSNCTNNNFSNITVTGATTLTGLNYTDGGTAPSRTVSGNTLSNWTGGTSAINCMNFTYWSGSTSTLNTNTVSNITGQGAVTGLTIGNSAFTANPMTVTNNTFTGLSSTGTGGAVTGITCSNASPVVNISANTINTLSSTGASLVSGITVSGATATHVFKNKIYDLTGNNASSTVSGVTVSGGTTVYVYNNLVGDLKAPNANAANPVNGLNITGGTTVNAYNNSVYIAATSIGALFGSSAVSVSTTPTVTLINNIFVNNSTPNGAGLAVAYRRSTTTLTTYGASSNTNDFYAPTIFTDGTNTDVTMSAYKTRVASRDGSSFSENPTFRSTTGSNSNYLKIDSTVATQIEGSGATISTPAITTDYYNIARYPNVGYPVNLSYPPTGPDIGANEFGGIPIDMVPPVISYTVLGLTGSLSDRTLSNVTITDASGVPITGALQPRIYYKKNAGSYFSSQGTKTSGSATSGVWSFTINNADMGGVAATDVISYFVIAQDVAAGGPFISANPGAGLVATDVNTVTTPPTTPNTYTIQQPPLSGTYTVGTSLFRPIGGGKLEFETRTRTVQRKVLAESDATSINTKTISDKSKLERLPEYKESDYVYTTIEETYQVPMVNGKEYTGSLYHEFSREEKIELGLPDNLMGVYATIAAAAADFNLRGVNGPTIFSLTDASYAEGNVVFNNGSDAPTTAANTLTIRPAAGVNVAITSSQSTLPIIKTIGISYMTIDGNPFGAESMTITNNSATAPIGLHIASSGTTVITQDTIKNVTTVGGLNSGTTTSAIGITISDQVAGGFGSGYANGIVVRNCSFQKSMFGALAIGGAAAGTQNMTNISFISNNMSTSGANCLGYCGLGLQGVNGGTIAQNTIANFETVSSLDHRGIWLPTAAKNIVVERNNINTLGYTGTSGYGNYGVLLTTGETASNNIVRNNVIADLWGDGWTHLTVLGDNTHGVYANGTQTGIKIYNNSISLGRNTLNQTDALTTGICLGTGSTADIRNNSIVNNAGLSAATGYGSTCIYLQSGVSQLENSNYNNLYNNATGSGLKLTGKVGTTNYATLALFKAATLLDASSISGDPAYTSATNLMPDITNSNSWTLAGNGVQGLVTNDYNGTSRSTTVSGGTVCIGAYEFTTAATPPTATASGAPANSTTTTYTLNGKTLCSIAWGAGGTVPTGVTFQYFPGVIPPGTPGGFKVSNGYWVITVPDGSGYSYDITFNYDDAMLGTITPEANIRLAKSENGGGLYTPFLVADDGSHSAGMYVLNTTANTILVYGLNSFSTFGLGDNDLPLPVELASFTSSIDKRNVELKWSTSKEENNAGFDIERKLVNENTWSKAGNIQGAGNTNVVKNYSFEDRNLASGKYNYRLKQVDFNGNYKYFNLSNEVVVGVPAKFELSQNYPNPFNPSTKINYDLPFDSKVQIKIFDMTGREVAQIVNETKTAGYYTVQFNASSMASGVYFYTISANGGSQSFTKTMKMVLVK